jgi:hypothetical protein
LIQAQQDLVKLRLRIGGQVGASWEVLPQQEIGVPIFYLPLSLFH